MRATFVNLRRDFTPPFVNRDRLMDDRPKERRLFLCLSFMLDDVPLWGSGEGGFLPPFMWSLLLKGKLFSYPFSPFFG